MPNLSSLVKQLKKERDRVERELSGLNAALTATSSEGFGAVGEAVEDDPTTECAAKQADDGELEKRALDEPLPPWFEQRVHQW